MQKKNILECNSICATCMYSATNCTTCAGKNRVAPGCDCANNTYNITTSINCLYNCPDSTY